MTAMTDPMKVLKEETAAQHESIEAKMTVMRPEFDLTAYRTMLGRFWNFYRVHDEATRGAGYPAGFEMEKRVKMPSIERDLRDLDLDPEPFRRDLQMPDLSTRGSRLGALYVTEGSTLGGQIISRHLSQKLGLSPEKGLSFFSGYGKDTGAMWTKLAALLRTELADPSQLREAVRAAQEMFVALEKAF